MKLHLSEFQALTIEAIHAFAKEEVSVILMAHILKNPK